MMNRPGYSIACANSTQPCRPTYKLGPAILDLLKCLPALFLLQLQTLHLSVAFKALGQMARSTRVQASASDTLEAIYEQFGYKK